MEQWQRWKDASVIAMHRQAGLCIASQAVEYPFRRLIE